MPSLIKRLVHFGTSDPRPRLKASPLDPQFPFLALSGEIRNKIYAYILPTEAIMVSTSKPQHPIWSTVHGPFRFKVPPTSSLAILQTCKQVFTEASYILHTTTLFGVKVDISKESDRDKIRTWLSQGDNADSTIPRIISRVVLTRPYRQKVPAQCLDINTHPPGRQGWRVITLSNGGSGNERYEEHRRPVDCVSFKDLYDWVYFPFTPSENKVLLPQDFLAEFFGYFNEERFAAPREGDLWERKYGSRARRFEPKLWSGKMWMEEQLGRLTWVEA